VLAGVPLVSIGLTAGVASASTAGSMTIYPGIDSPYGITAGPDGALWFTNNHGNSIGRITTSGKVTTYTGTGIDGPEGITAGPDGALWFTNFSNNSIGRITTSGTVTNYTGTGIDEPDGITAGPDGALWFTNGDSIGRITTSGTVTDYTHSGIEDSAGITAGPDGALWFTSTDAIGRITTAVTPGISGFTPTSGVAGTAVTITGQNLSGATAVAFDGIPATIVSDTATQVVADVPSGAATGHITVTTAVGTATSQASFTVT
jgi:streptogramin lyase